ncbi:Uncharacterized protein DBV15_12714 [Temnothorax longispinosus]|uniref:Peptidase A2 domain-containing protein n=1 Tax=Temnothorax longispinosus TaxID=300112 RepID=A0A4S2KL42_9HYME|nr:Uncharacterized protein DBV15_12714 [Temnothorax longispinosus]
MATADTATEYYGKPPKSLDLSGNISENWRKFKQSFDIFLKASGSIRKPDEIKVAILLNIVGEDGIELYNTFNLQEAERNNLAKVLQCFEEYCVPKKNIVYETFKFSSRMQQEGEKFDSFLAEIKKLSQTCEFGTMADRMVRDRIVLGIKDKVLQERLLRVEDLNLQKAIDYCRAAEVSKVQAKSLQGDKAEIDSIRKKVQQKSNSSFCIDQVEIGNINSRWFEMIQINNSIVKFKLDTGADVNVLPLKIYNKVKKSKVKLESASIILESFGGTKIKPLGIAELLCTIKDVTKKQNKGNMVRRNSSHLKKTKTEFKSNYDEDFDDRTKRNERNDSIVPDNANTVNEERQQMKATRSGRMVKPPVKLRDYVL